MSFLMEFMFVQREGLCTKNSSIHTYSFFTTFFFFIRAPRNYTLNKKKDTEKAAEPNIFSSYARCKWVIYFLNFCKGFIGRHVRAGSQQGPWQKLVHLQVHLRRNVNHTDLLFRTTVCFKRPFFKMLNTTRLNTSYFQSIRGVSSDHKGITSQYVSTLDSVKHCTLSKECLVILQKQLALLQLASMS